MEWLLFLTVTTINEALIGANIAGKRQEINDGAGQITVSGKGKVLNGKITLDVHFEIDGGLPGMGGGTAGPPGTSGTPGAGGAPKEPGTGSGPVTPGTGSVTGMPGIGTFSQEEINALNEHNRFRAIHDAPPMKLNRTMCDAAAQWAKVIAEKGALEHTTDDQRPNQGENLSMGCSSDMPQSVEEAVASWYNEVCVPGYEGLGEVETGPREAGHFSQVVWKSSLVLGIGRAEIEQDGMKCAYIVGRYTPPGNMVGNYKENVLLGSFARDVYCATVKQMDQNQRDIQGKTVTTSSQVQEEKSSYDKEDSQATQHPYLLIAKRRKEKTLGLALRRGTLANREIANKARKRKLVNRIQTL